MEMILDGYWKDRPDIEMKTRILADWADTLEDWPQGDVLDALRKWRNENPNKKPNPGHILGLLKEARGKAEAAKAPKPTPQPELVNTDTSEEARAERAEKAARIMAEVVAGYTEKE